MATKKTISSKFVTVPKKYGGKKSGTHEVELAYITKEEAEHLKKLDLHNSGIDKENHYGPKGIPNYDGGGTGLDDNGDDDNGDDGGGIDYGAFGKPDPFASINRKRQMFYHPMMGGTAHGNVYDPYSGERPDYIDENIWDYKPPRAGAELKNWAGDLRKWASGD